MRLQSFVQGEWRQGDGEARALCDATTGKIVAELSSLRIDGAALLRYARGVGGPAVRRLTFHDRAALLKALAKELSEHKEDLYALSRATGATQADCVLDVDGGLGTLFSYASRGTRELPNAHVYLEGATESLAKTGGFVGQHICVPLEGAAVLINAYNFPVWGMLEKLAPAFLAGMPVVVKPASATAYVAASLARSIVDSKLLPEGTFQLICGDSGDLLDQLTCQDVVAFTGSASTAQRLRANPAIVRNAVRLIAETDSLNASVLGPDAAPGTPEFDLFVAEIVREMTYKAGQRCTAIRRALVPDAHFEAASAALGSAFAKIVVGDPRLADVQMGPLASLAQRREFLARVEELCREAESVSGDPRDVEPRGTSSDDGAFVAPTLLRVRDPDRAEAVHAVEAFGPACTLLPYRSLAHAVELARRGEGSLVASVFTADPSIARELIVGLAPYHGRVLIVDRDCAKEQTGHGSPLPGLVHGGPGRAGGGEELGGLRAVLHYMQRTAVQCTPRVLASLSPS